MLSLKKKCINVYATLSSFWTIFLGLPGSLNFISWNSVFGGLPLGLLLGYSSVSLPRGDAIFRGLRRSMLILSGSNPCWQESSISRAIGDFLLYECCSGSWYDLCNSRWEDSRSLEKLCLSSISSSLILLLSCLPHKENGIKQNDLVLIISTGSCAALARHFLAPLVQVDQLPWWQGLFSLDNLLAYLPLFHHYYFSKKHEN